MGKFFQFVGYLLVMLSIIPIAGYLVTGTWRGAWAYARDWARAVLIMICAGFVLAIIMTPW
jgi:hypothetical protein